MENKYTGIVLGKRDIGETDRLYIFYTLEKGKIKAVARGVRKAKAKLAGNLENFNLVDVSIAKSKGMGNITSVIVEDNFLNLRKNFNVLKSIFESTKAFENLMNEEEGDEKVFNLLLRYLKTLKKISNKKKGNIDLQTDLVSQSFIFKLLDFLGYRINADNCVICQKKIDQDRNCFDSEQGGILCKECLLEAKNAIPVSDNFIKIIRIVYNNKLESITKLKIGEKESRELRMISQDFLRWIV